MSFYARENTRDVANDFLQVQELLKDVESYQRDVQDLLRPCDILPSARLKLLVDRSIEIDIDIAESKSLKWVNHVTRIRVILPVIVKNQTWFRCACLISHSWSTSFFNLISSLLNP